MIARPDLPSAGRLLQRISAGALFGSAAEQPHTRIFRSIPRNR